MGNRIYISGYEDKSISSSQITSIINTLKNEGFIIVNEEEHVRTANFVLAILPDFKWSSDRHVLNKDLRIALEDAIHYKVPVFVAYRTAGKAINFYETLMSASSITGLANTSHILLEKLKNNKTQIWHDEEEEEDEDDKTGRTGLVQKGTHAKYPLTPEKAFRTIFTRCGSCGQEHLREVKCSCDFDERLLLFM